MEKAWEHTTINTAKLKGEQMEIIEGKTVKLRPVVEMDAKFILDLRQQEEIARYLHKIDITVEQEQEWIQKTAADGDYNFIIYNMHDEPIGMIALCNINGSVAETGRLASLGGVLENIESCLLIYDFAFDYAGIERLEGTVMCQNKKVKSMQEKFGCKFDTQPSEMDGFQVYYARLTREEYKRHRPKVAALIAKAAKITQ